MGGKLLFPLFFFFFIGIIYSLTLTSAVQHSMGLCCTDVDSLKKITQKPNHNKYNKSAWSHMCEFLECTSGPLLGEPKAGY